MNDLKLKSLQSIKFLIELNFYFSVIVLVAGSLLSVSGNFFFFEFNEDLYGALDNNLRMMMIYLAVTEVVVFGYCFLTKHFKAMILVGFFLILMIGSLEFYGEVNTVAIDPDFPLFFLYTGISHLLFGVKATIEKNSAIEQSGNLSK